MYNNLLSSFCNIFKTDINSLSAEKTFVYSYMISEDVKFCNLANLSAGTAANLRQCRRVACYSALGGKNSWHGNIGLIHPLS